MNPFAEDAARKQRRRGRSILAWLAVLLLAGLSAGAVWGWPMLREKIRSIAALRPSLEEAKANLAEASASLAKALEELQEGKAQLAALQTQLARLEQEKAAATQAAKHLEDQMRADLESKDVTISKLQGKLTVNILDRVMFNSGEAVLKPDGEAVLRKIAALLGQHPELKIHVIGHTDNVPIRNRFSSNWELSTARALAAVHFLTEKAGVAPDRVGALGYGEYRPIGDNSTPEGRAKNRRIAITILSDELAGTDLAPVVPANTPALLPPDGSPPEAASADLGTSESAISTNEPPVRSLSDEGDVAPVE